MRKHITGFYIEVLLLIVVFIGMILVLTRIFGLGKMESTRARLLTNAVTLAGNAAEAVSGSKDPADLLILLNEKENAERSENMVYAHYKTDMTPAANGEFEVAVDWQPEEDGLAKASICVFYREEETPVYTLETSVYTPAVGGVVKTEEVAR